MKTKSTDPVATLNSASLKRVGEEAIAKRNQGLIEAVQEASVPPAHLLDWFVAEYPERDIDELYDALTAMSETSHEALSGVVFASGNYDKADLRAEIFSTRAKIAAFSYEGEIPMNPSYSPDDRYHPELPDETAFGMFNALGLGRESQPPEDAQPVHSTKTGDHHPTQLGTRLEEALGQAVAMEVAEHGAKVAEYLNGHVGTSVSAEDAANLVEWYEAAHPERSLDELQEILESLGGFTAKRAAVQVRYHRRRLLLEQTR